MARAAAPATTARGHHGSGGSDAGSGGSGEWGGMKRGADGKPDYGDKKPVWKLGEDGKPKMVLIKPGLTDGQSTQLLGDELAPGDQLITEVQGLPAAPANTRKVGVFLDAEASSRCAASTART